MISNRPTQLTYGQRLATGSFVALWTILAFGYFTGPQITRVLAQNLPATPPVTPPQTPAPTREPLPTPTVTPYPTATPTPAVTPIPVIKTLTVSLNSITDGVNQDGGRFSYNYREIWLGTGQNVKQSYAGLRFNQLNIPQKATIISAMLQVYTPRATWTNMAFRTYGHAADNSPTFSYTTRPSTRALTNANTLHNSNVAWNTKTWYTVSDVRPIISEIINRSGWKSGQSLSLVLKGAGSAYGRKFVNDFAGTDSLAPRLIITYR